MKIQIKKKYSNEILIEGEAESLKDFVVKKKASLWGADLLGANLRGADLRGAKIKITQKDDLIKALGIRIVD